MITPTTDPATSLRTLIDAIAVGQQPGRDVLAATITRAIGSLPTEVRPSWSVTSRDAEVVLHRVLVHVARLTEVAAASSQPRWTRTTAA